ncbi:MAG: acyltransferase domain-containing protein, partial [Acidimicrobiales bacterium]
GDLRSRRCDLALAGGVHTSTPAPILQIFCQLGALSRRGQLRPFDADADGTLLGEGLGFVVLKRAEDAERDGDRIYAVLRAIGVASDGRGLGLLAPRVEGEELALRHAYEAAGIPPDGVGLLEAHGTGTPAGDAAEIEALSRVFGRRGEGTGRCALGSVKSMISHLIPAAGIAGLIKVALALHHRVLPPTLHCDAPNPALRIEDTPFYINTQVRPWIHGGPTPRRAGVNAFGFGGINAHAIVEEHQRQNDGEPRDLVAWDSEVLVLEATSRRELARACEELAGAAGEAAGDLGELARSQNARLADLPLRLAVVASSAADLGAKLADARARLADPTCAQIRERGGIYFFEEPLAGQGALAFCFPGEGSQYPRMLLDLCLHFPEVRAWFDLLDRAFTGHRRRYLPSEVIFPTRRGDEEAAEGRLWQMDCGPEAIFAANQALLTLLGRLEIHPDAVVGHSTGEYSALVASGAHRIADPEQLTRDMLRLNELYERSVAEGLIPPGVLLTVGGGDPDALFALAQRSPSGLRVAMDNCPHQVVLCAPVEGAEQTMAMLRGEGFICTPLPFRRAYHTPAFEPFCEQLAGFFGDLSIGPPTIPIYSCTTAKPYPHDQTSIRALASGQWARPVHFRETVEAMYDAGTRVFVEVGPKGNL